MVEEGGTMAPLLILQMADGEMEMVSVRLMARPLMTPRALLSGGVEDGDCGSVRDVMGYDILLNQSVG